MWVKWEGANPTGSMKDRMALSMIEGAERRGDLRPGGHVVEYTGGSTGSSLAMVCAAKGYAARLVTSDSFADEKIHTMRAFGATVEVLPGPGGKISAELIQRMIARARELSAAPDAVWTDQVNNPDNRDGYRGLGQEIVEQTGGELDAFVQCVGTGGSFSGVSEVLKDRVAGVRCVAVEPSTSRALSGGPTGNHSIEGIGMGFVPSIMRIDLADEIVAVPSEDAATTARALAEQEGLFAGTSSGANVLAALQIARRLGAGGRVVTVLIDSGLKYLAGDLFR